MQNQEEIKNEKEEMSDDENLGPKPKHSVKTIAEWVAIIIALGISMSLLVVTVGVVWVALTPGPPESLGENSTQILTGWGGGMIGILGAFIGYAFGRKSNGGS